MKYEDLTRKDYWLCYGGSFAPLGNGFQEVIYQRALAIEMTFTRFGIFT
ncbi:MAG: hypothetical protein V9E96_03105 [Chitinophagaceae bacterium]